MSKDPQMAWKPPKGWKIAQNGKLADCAHCFRPLRRGDTILRSKRNFIRCVDVSDCQSVIRMGREPSFRVPYFQFARDLDRKAGRV